jgi:hypothetical protein
LKQKNRSFIIAVGAILFTSSIGARAFARVFRMSNESVAAYFGGTYAPSSLKQTHFSGTSGTGATIDKSALTNYGGEFGVLFTSQAIGMRLGMELIKPGTLTKAVGADSGGQKLYDFESSISALVPKVTIELNLKTADTWRVFLALGGGTAAASYKNSYTLAVAGQAAYPGVADFSEEGTGNAILYDGALGFESLMNDTTTIALSVGYRKLEITQYKYKTNVTNFSGAHLKNEIVLNDDGTNKTSMFTGATGFLVFRFYLGK